MQILLIGGGYLEIFHQSRRYFESSFYLFFCLFYFFSFLPKILSNILQNICVGIMMIIGVVELFLIINFYSTFTYEFADTLLSTNFREATEFLKFYLPKAFFAISLFLVISVAFLFLPFKVSLKFPKISIKFLNQKTIYFALFLVFASLLVTKYHKHFSFERSFLVQYSLIFNHAFIKQNEYIAQLKDLKNKLNETLLQDYPLQITQEIPKIVLIIGESTQRNYMNLYGYPLENTPNLTKKAQNGEIFVFNDVISPHSHTNPTLAKVLTFSNYENQSTDWFKYFNIVQILNLAGYYTYWLSNQESVSIYGNVPETIARLSKEVHYTNKNSLLSNISYYDEVLLDMLLKIDDKNEKSFFVFHLMGTHGGYKGRYPKNFEKFSPQDVKSHSNYELKNYQAKTLSHYINAIYYNDKVVNDIFEAFKNENAIIFYLSDHAEEVYNFRDFAGHTETMGSGYMVEIPFIIYCTQQFRQNYPHLIEKIKNSQNLPFMSDDFIHAFLDIIGIYSKDFKEHRSLFNENFDKNRIRVYAGKNYDTELKNANKEENLMAPHKIYLHRTDEIKKFNDFSKIYQNFEIDVHYLDSYFDVGHDGKQTSIGLDLLSMLMLAKNRDKDLPPHKTTHF